MVVVENNVVRGNNISKIRWHNHLAPDVNKKPWSHE